MATIGTFTAKDGKLFGSVRTLTIDAKLAFIPNADASANAPTYRVFCGKTEVGGAWEKTSESGRTYHSVKLDDPTFAAPIFANLIEQDDGGFALLWSRPRRD